MKFTSYRKVFIISGITYIFFLILLTLLYSCKKQEFEKVVRIKTGEISNIAINSAKIKGIIQDVGENGITQYGHCWSIDENPDEYLETKTEHGSMTNIGIYYSILSKLLPGTTYYVRAYAISEGKTTYGNEVSFTTNTDIPTVVTNSISSITEISAQSGGNVTSDGGATVTARGVCWSTSENPTDSNSKTTDGSGTGSFISNISGLSPGTNYYVRAYATNIAGTAYGNEVSFITNTDIPTVVTNSISSITETSAQSGGNVTSDGGATVTTRGVCWSTSENPQLSDSYTTDGSGTGSFTSNITGLSPYITYYVRAYATNIHGTAYGLQYSFFTFLYYSTISDYDGNVYNTVKIGGQIWMAENLKTTKYNNGTDIPLVTDNTAWANLTTPAYCWYNNNSSYKDTYGALYNWYTVNTGNLCPSGWHVPSDAEWTTLIDYLGGEPGGKLKETDTTHWHSPNIGATNESGFTALPGGVRDVSGMFGNIGYYGYWWSATEDGTDLAWYRDMTYNGSYVARYNTHKKLGFSVRCVRD